MRLCILLAQCSLLVRLIAGLDLPLASGDRGRRSMRRKHSDPHSEALQWNRGFQCTGRTPRSHVTEDFPLITPDDKRPVIPEGSSTILFIFAGRERFIRVLFHLIRPLVPSLLSEVHVWDVTRTKSDAAFLRAATANSSDFRFFPLNAAMPTASKSDKWRAVYLTYASNLCDETIIIKCDDDIVYIANLAPLVHWLRSNSSTYVAIPAIVNNDVSAKLMLQSGQIHSLSCPAAQDGLRGCDVHGSTRNVSESGTPCSHWWEQEQCAEEVHRLFLDGRIYQNSSVVTWTAPVRFSINFIAFRGEFARSAFASDCMADDERCLSHDFPLKLMERGLAVNFAAVLSTTVVHYSFESQRSNWFHPLPDALLNSYETLSGLSQTDFSTLRIVRSSCVAVALMGCVALIGFVWLSILNRSRDK